MGWVYDQHIRLANMSLGFFEDSVPLERATKRLYEAGVIMVAAAGNHTGSSATTADGGGASEGGGDFGEGTASTCDASQLNIAYPARYPWVIAVAATDYRDWITDYSLSGPEVDMAAPGGAQVSERILSTNWNGGYALASGTSQAAAYVTGSIALALQRYPGLSFNEVLARLRRTAWDLGYPEERQGAGLIDVLKLVETLP
jgi:subtilisin family serine protease